MSSNDNAYKGSTFWQLILVIPGTILAFTLIISLIAKTSGVVNAPATSSEPAASDVAKVEENIKPVASVKLAAADAGPHVDKSGAEVVKAVCSMCHAAGLMNAPKIGDKDAWKPRIAQGYDTLISHAINGIRSMPARGGNPALTDGEIANAVANMANAGGANFTPPTSKSPVASNSGSNVAAVKSEMTKVTGASSEKKAEKKAEVKSDSAEVKAETVAAVAANPVGKSGEEVYKAVCSMCHAAGLMAAPKFGDKGLWAPRIAQGYDTLVSHAINGIRVMPAKGGNSSLSDKEVAKAVKYMANEAGAGFK